MSDVGCLMCDFTTAVRALLLRLFLLPGEVYFAGLFYMALLLSDET